ncbi:MAG TPA: YegS/Rv2252/BmrU family lipid kinase [Vicinamibacterales bacterium]|nr:YegS/Rv2252/BmrU family lipid kinase [Vicinamibacterales bacterium]
MRAAVIINPKSGRAPGITPAGKVEMAVAVAAACGVEVDVAVTERAGHGRDLARAFAAAGAGTVVAWGGDGTVNEVAGAIAGGGAAFGIVPAGSGDGFATTLGIARDPRQALRAALTGRVRPLDVGEVNGRPFLNLAGIGFDARVARRFNRLTKRGGLPYLLIGLHEGLTYGGREYRVHLDDQPFDLRAFLIVFANGQQYGNNAVIAPGARFDDGLLDALIVDARPFFPQLWRARRLFMGREKAIDGIVRRPVRRAVVEADGPIEIHLDGECMEIGNRIEVGVRPGALRLRL